MTQPDAPLLKKCRYGWMLLDGSPHISKCFELYGEYSECEVAAMRNFVKAGDVVLDIGANIGDLTVPLSQMVGAEGRVYAVESHPDIFNIMCANLALNKIQNVRPMNVFVKNSEDALMQKQFFRPGTVTPSTRIDDWGLEKCSFIKIDVDGNERDVLQSGTNTIEKFRPPLYLENDIHENSKALLEYLQSLDYDAFWHIAPIFSPENFYNNPVNNWEPHSVVSQMILAVPKEHNMTIAGLRPVQNADEWLF